MYHCSILSVIRKRLSAIEAQCTNCIFNAILSDHHHHHQYSAVQYSDVLCRDPPPCISFTNEQTMAARSPLRENTARREPHWQVEVCL